MKARTNNITHPNGFILTTPVLVKSFSSKGFNYKIEPNSNKVSSNVNKLLDDTREALTDTVLISAYDLRHYLPDIQNLSERIFPEFLFIDSGGYETSDSYDFSDIYQYPRYILEKKLIFKIGNFSIYKEIFAKWNRSEYEKVLDTLSDSFAAIITSYDNANETKQTIENQVQQAEDLFKKYPNCLRNFLVKPSAGDFLDIDEIFRQIDTFRKFDIIGLTEKELAPDLLHRMQNIKVIREKLDSMNITAPLHIFGSLDPIATVLYFLVGAEIFDGLTWLRFSYYNGLSIYKHNYNAIMEREGVEDEINETRMYFDNINYLSKLQGQMRSFLGDIQAHGLNDQAFIHFGERAETIKRIYNNFESRF